MPIIKPRFYPHRGFYAYSRRGFDRRVVARLRARGFTVREVERLRDLYFRDRPSSHQDPLTGAFCFVRRYRLYWLARDLGYDRRSRLLELLERSGLFYVIRDEEGERVRVLSPYTRARMGVISIGC